MENIVELGIAFSIEHAESSMWQSDLGYDYHTMLLCHLQSDPYILLTISNDNRIPEKVVIAVDPNHYDSDEYTAAQLFLEIERYMWDKHGLKLSGDHELFEEDALNKLWEQDLPLLLARPFILKSITNN